MRLRAESIDHPRAQARITQPNRPAVQHAERRSVDDGFVIAGADHGHVVGEFLHSRENVGYLQARLPAARERPPRTHQLRLFGVDLRKLNVSLEKAGQKRLALKPMESRLGISCGAPGLTAGGPRAPETLRQEANH